MALFSKFLRSPPPRPERSRRTRLYLETLESRIVPYTNSGYLWPHPQLVTISFVPDGTVLAQSFKRVGDGVQGFGVQVAEPFVDKEAFERRLMAAAGEQWQMLGEGECQRQ